MSWVCCLSVQSKNFSDLDPSMALYAQGLLDDVSKHMEENEEVRLLLFLLQRRHGCSYEGFTLSPISPASHSYSPTSFRSDPHVAGSVD